MKSRIALLFAAIALAMPGDFLRAAGNANGATISAENPYDVLGKTLAPFANLLAKNSKNPNRAMTADLRLASAENIPALAPGQTLHAAVEFPDKLFLHAPVLGEQVTICRNGQDIWAAPGSKIDALLNSAALPQPPKKYKLGDFSLPVPEKELVFLPVLFQVADGGNEMLGEQSCRVLNVKLMPELARALGVEDWSARLWVRADYKPAQIALSKADQRAVIAFDKLDFLQTLPPETWQPAPGETDVTHLPPIRYKQLLDAIGANAAR